MFLEVLEKNKGKKIVTAVVAEGEHQEHPCPCFCISSYSRATL